MLKQTPGRWAPHADVARPDMTLGLDAAAGAGKSEARGSLWEGLVVMLGKRGGHFGKAGDDLGEMLGSF